MRQEVKTTGNRRVAAVYERGFNYNNLGGKILMFWIEGQKKFPKKLIGSIALLIGTINGALIYYLKTLLDPR